MSKWYFKDGTIAVDIDQPDWLEKMEKVSELLADPKYKRVAEDTIGKYWISTVWLGLDYGWPISNEDQTNYAPVIFETMVFDTSEKTKYTIGKKTRTSIGEDVDVARYSTEAEALAGHQKMVRKYKKVVAKQEISGTI